MKKQQVILIHGGDTFDSREEYLKFLKEFDMDFAYLERKGWKDNFEEKLGKSFEVIAPKMPNKWNAKYEEWKIWFEKLIPFFEETLVFVGHSLGGIFLVKYFSENKITKKIAAIFLVAAPYEGRDSEYSLADFVLPNDFGLLVEQVDEIFIYHSKDDPVVPFADFEKYKKALPGAHAFVFENRGHFNQETFPELIKAIQKL